MFQKLKEIDRFYMFLGLLLAVLSVVVIIMVRTVFGAYATASHIEEESLESNLPRINKTSLDEVYDKFYNKTPPVLDL